MEKMRRIEIDYTAVILISIIFLAQMLVLTRAQTNEEKIAALEKRISDLETALGDTRDIAESVAFLALFIAISIPIYYSKIRPPASLAAKSAEKAAKK